MYNLNGYQLLHEIDHKRGIKLYRMLCLADHQKVIVKTTSDEYPAAEMIASFRFEYDVLMKMSGRGTLEAYHLQMKAERPVLVLQDVEGCTLTHAIRTRSQSMDMVALLRIAIAITDCISQLHHEQITLNEITPDHFIVNLDTYEVKCIDIRMSSTDMNYSPLIDSVGRLDAVLAYIAPEQTGRTGTDTDYRSDYYSLGIVLYEWFSRQLPFEAKDTLDMVYHHLASNPIPLHHRVPNIPKMIEDIVSKCMEKMPDARYASAYGIKHDLVECYTKLLSSHSIAPFTLAEHDRSTRLLITNSFYGRSHEQERLERAIYRAAEGATELILINGASGIGKTAFVLETLKKNADQVGFMAIGRFTSDHDKRPFGVWLQVMDELVSQLLTLSKLQVEVWKLRILSEVVDFGQLLIELVPKLQLLIGEQPLVQQLPPVEAQHRFQMVMNRFLQLFLDREHPLVLLLDDLQWADKASLQFLAYMLEDREKKHLLVVGAYRDGEITSEHPLRRMLETIQLEEDKIDQFQLDGLDCIYLQQIMNDATFMESDQTSALTDVLYTKTAGNPFIFKQLLQDLVAVGHLRLDESSSSHRWVWDMESILEMNVADNEVDYLLVKFSQLSAEAAEVLGCAALLGSRFDLNSLASLTGDDPLQLSEAVSVAVRERLLQPIQHEGMLRYKFQHDRIQQAAYASIPEMKRGYLHLQLGRRLAEQLQSEGDADVFHAVNHLNKGLEQLNGREQRLELAELNLRAGMKAKQATAYESALIYLRQATALLDETCWHSRYSFTFRAYKERAESEFLCEYFTKADELFQLLMQKAASDLDKAHACAAMIQLESSRDNYEQVLQLGNRALRLLGVKHINQPNNVQLLTHWMRLRRKLRKHSIDSIEQLPAMTDEAYKIAMLVLMYVTGAYFNQNAAKKSWASATFLMLEITLKHGIAPESSLAFVGYALFQYHVLHQYEKTSQWGMLACRIAKPYPFIYVKVLTAFSICDGSWRRHEPQLLETFSAQAGKVGLESGDIWQGNQSVLTNCAFLLQYGHPLGDIYTRLIAHSSDFLRHQDSFHWRIAAAFSYLLSRLTGFRAPDDPFAAIDVEAEHFTESIHGDAYETTQDVVYSIHYISDYLFGNYELARTAITKSIAIIESRRDDMDFYSGQYMYESLILAALYEQWGADERDNYVSRIRNGLKRLRVYAKRSPENNLHKYLLVRAELARISRKDRLAEQLYEQSIESARQYGHIHNVAIASECYSRYGLSRGREQLAKIYMMEAYEAYLKWGAHAKAADLVEKYSHLLHIRKESSLERIDYLSLFMSSQALSGEMEMGRLLETFMRIMLHNCGAEYGAFMLESDGSSIVEAYGSAEELRIEAIPLEQAMDIVPTAIIGYTARTREALVLHDAAKEGMFARSDYVRQHQLKSIICLPLMHQNQIVAVLYLENKLSTHVFTRERLDVLQLLCTQCAISIQNAKLYSGIQQLKHSLEEQVEERTRSLELSMEETSAALAERSIFAERNRIAQEIHDIVGHTLTSTMFQIEAGKRLLHKDMQGAVDRLQEAQQLVRHSLNEIRGSVHMLKEDKYFDIEQSLQQLMKSTERNMGVVIHAEIGELPKLTTEQKKTIYHALQEGLTNGIRHGGSTVFHFMLVREGDNLLFQLRDNGEGTNELELGFGLKSMRERVESLGGSLHMESRRSGGYTIMIAIPSSYSLM